MYPKSDGWGMQAVPQELGTFANRRDLPAEWAGLSGDELAAASGVAGRGVLPHGAVLHLRRHPRGHRGARPARADGVARRGAGYGERVKLVITGATGNVGTSLLAALRTDTSFDEIVGSPAARRASTSPASDS